MAQRLELDLQLLKVIDLAVISDDQVGGLVSHRLPAGRREVDDRQATMAEAHRSIGVDPVAVGAPMSDNIRHRLEQAGRHRLALQVINARDSAHTQSLTALTVKPLSCSSK